MSIKLLDRCWRFSKVKGGDLLVLLGIADFANDEGVAYPSIPTLAKKARLTPRNTQRAIRRLVATRELHIEDGKGPHRVHLYRITLMESPKPEGCQPVMLTKRQDDIRDMGRVTFQPPNPSEETVIKIKRERVDDKLSPSKPDSSTRSLTPDTICTQWNSIPGVKRCKTLGATIRYRVHARIKEHPDVAWWDILFQQIRASDFLCGRIAGKTGDFHASLDWILGPKNLDKILAGNYDPDIANGPGPSLTCTKRIQPPGDKFLRPCGQPASPASRPTEPRCSAHLGKADRTKELTHATHGLSKDSAA